MKKYNHFLDENPSYKDSKFIIIPAPLEYSVSYGTGTKLGPEKILEASIQLETYDIETQKEVVYSGVYTDKTVIYNDDINLFMNNLEQRVSSVLEDEKIPIILGGEHSISASVISSFKKIYNDISILHFDAHLDLRKTYEGTKYSHACVMRRVIDELNINNIVSLGIRSVSPEENEFIKTTTAVKVCYAEEILNKNFNIEHVLNLLTDNIYISFDVDVFDPTVIPSTGTPEPGGLFWYDVINILRILKKTKKRILGFDVVELAPDRINHHSEFTIAKLIYKIINYI